MKRIISIIGVLIFLLNSAVSCFAVANADDSYNNTSVKLVSALGIMSVDENTGMFWDDTPVERREMAMILCNLFKLEPTNDVFPRFNDVAEEDRSYIETAVRNGYMSGIEEKRFAPKECVTGEQLAKIFVSVIGGTPMAEALGGYPFGYVQAANKLGLLKDHSTPVKGTAKRIDVANIIAAALDAEMLISTGINKDGILYTLDENATFLTEVMGIYRVEGVVTRNAFTALDNPDGMNDDRVMIGGKMCHDSQHIAENYLGYYITAYVHISDGNSVGDIIYVEAQKNNVVEVDGSDFIDVSGITVNYFDGDSKKSLEMTYVCDLIYNGKAIEFDAEKFNVKTGNLKFIDNDGNGKYDVVIINEFSVCVAEKINIDDETIMLKFGQEPLRLKENVYRVYRDGVEIDISDISSGEVLYNVISTISEKEKNIRIYVTDDRILGTVSSISSADGKSVLKINGKKYVVSEYCDELMTKNYLNKIAGGDSGQFFLGYDGEIVYFDADAEEKQIGYMIDSAFEIEGFNSALSLKIYTEEGQIKTLKAEDKVKFNGKKTEISKIKQNLFENSQLVEYSENDGKLTELNLAVAEQDEEKFSIDFSGSLKCVSKSVLGYKYITTASTKVFRVPTVSENTENYENIINNAALYQNLSGTYFNGGTTYTVSLYDLNEYNEAKFAVVSYNPFAADIWYNYPMLLITEVSEGIENDEEIVTLKGLNEKGTEETLVCTSRTVLMDTVLKREPIIGDVLQYRNGDDGKLAQIIIQHDAEQKENYGPKTLDKAIDGMHVSEAFGDVSLNDGMNITVRCTSNTGFDFVVRNVSGIAYRYYKDRQVINKVDFADIEPGSKIYACCNYSGLRIIVVYE